MEAKVYYADMQSRSDTDNKLAKIARLCDAVGLKKVVVKDAPVAIKLHFGEYGNDTHLNPTFVRQVVDKVQAAGGKAFLTDTNTLYSGSRQNAVDHLHTAYLHGFTPSVVYAPVIIADGINGRNDDPVVINKKHFKEVYIAREIVSAESMVVLSHFKGHQLAGFGGAIKNLAMGCAGPRGKQAQHASKISVNTDVCIACGKCAKVCPKQAITVKKGGKAEVDPNKCIGCCECVTVCEPKAVGLDQSSERVTFLERLTEYAYGAALGKKKRVCYINFVLSVTPDCDCCPWSDATLVPDLGILASTDPVALDKACFDLVQGAVSLRAMPGNGVNVDKFTACWPESRGPVQFNYGAAIGLGQLDYKLIKV